MQFNTTSFYTNSSFLSNNSSLQNNNFLRVKAGIRAELIWLLDWWIFKSRN